MKLGDLYMTVESYRKMANPVGTIGKVTELNINDLGNFRVVFDTGHKSWEFEPDNIAYFGTSWGDDPEIERIAPVCPALEIIYGI